MSLIVVGDWGSQLWIQATSGSHVRLASLVSSSWAPLIAHLLPKKRFKAGVSCREADTQTGGCCRCWYICFFSLFLPSVGPSSFLDCFNWGVG